MTKNLDSRKVIAETQRVTEQFQPEIRRARYQRLTIYEVEESELQVLENGSPDTILLTIAIALFTLAITLTVTLFTATFASSTIHTVVIIVTVIGYVVGMVLTAFWFRSRSSVSKCVQGIRDRLPPEWVLDSSTNDQKTESPIT